MPAPLAAGTIADYLFFASVGAGRKFRWTRRLPGARVPCSHPCSPSQTRGLAHRGALATARRRVSRSLNKATLIGNVGGDPDIRATSSGSRVGKVSLATSRSYQDRSGQQHDSTDWHRLTFFGKLVDVVEQYVSKGDRLYVEGRIQYSQVEDERGTRYFTDIIVQEMIMLGSPGRRDRDGGGFGGHQDHRYRGEGGFDGQQDRYGGGRQRGDAPQTAAANAGPADGEQGGGEPEDDLPF